MNFFRIAGDIIRLFTVIALPTKIWTYKNAAGVSGKTQVLYTIVCTTRYLDLFTTFISEYNTALKVVFLLLAYLTVYLIYGKFKDTRSRNEDSFKIGYLLSFAAVLALIINYGWARADDVPVISYSKLLNRGLYGFDYIEICWAFSIFLEAVAILPQLLMIYEDKTRETPPFILYYVFAMGFYRALYAMNWVYKYYNLHSYDIISDSAGGVQVAFYVVFAFIYIMRRSPYDKIVIADTPIAVHI